MEAVPGRADEKDAAVEGYFFETAGAVKFSHASTRAAGHAVTLVAADRYGFVAYSDLSAVYVASTNQLLEAASSKVKRPPVLDPATVCVSMLPLANVTILALSADQLLLACVMGSSVHLFSLPNLLNHQSDAPLYSMDLSKELTQFSWCPDVSARDSTSFIAVTADQLLLHGSLMSGSGILAEGVECACWSPDGQHIAYTTGSKLTVTAADWKETAFMVNIPPPDGEDGEGEHVLDSLSWPTQNAIAASSLWYDESNEDEHEGPDAYLLGVTWDSWTGTATAEPQGVKVELTSYVVMANYDEDPGCGQHEWPYMRSVYVPAWQLLVHSHRKAFDEHIRLLEFAEGQTFALEQSETKLVAAVPTPDDGENFIVGMAIDYSNQAPIPHPTSQEKPDVAASCILLVATVDGVLRMYRLANFEKQQGLARQPEPVPNSLPQNVLHALAAAKNALLEEESETSVSSPSPPLASFMQHAASTQSSTTGAAASTAAAGTAASQLQRRSTDSLAISSSALPVEGHQQEAEAAAAAVALPSEDGSDFEELEDGEIAADGDEKAVVRGAAGVASDDGGWGSSEADDDDDDAQEATSGPVQGTAAPAATSAAEGPGAFPFASASGTMPDSSTVFGGLSATAAVASQPFGTASSTPMFSFATAGGSSSNAAPAAVGSSSSFGGLAATAGSAPAFGAFGTASTAPVFSFASMAASAFGSFGSASVAAASKPAASTPVAPAPASGSGEPVAAVPVLGTTVPSQPAFGAPTAAASPGLLFSTPAFGSAPSAAAAASPFSAPVFGTPAANAASSAAAPSAGLSFAQSSTGSSVASPFGGDFTQSASAAPAAAGKGAFVMPPIASADTFQPSIDWQGPKPGLVFTTGAQGTGYYRDNASQSTVAAPAAAPAGAVSQPAASSGAESAAASVAPQAPAATVVHKTAAQAQQQQQPARKTHLQVPSARVAAPKPQLVGQGQEVAEAEATFLESLHKVSIMSAELQQLMDQVVPKDVNSWDLAKQTQQIRKDAKKLLATHKQQKQSASGLIDSWEEVNRQQAALAMFHPNTAGTAAIEAQMPLEPALAALQDNIQESFSAINANMEDLEQQLERWEQTVGAAAAAARPQRTPLMGAKAAAGGLSAGKAYAAGPFKGIGLKSTSPWGFKAGPGRVVSSAVSPVHRPSTAAGGAASAANAQVELLYRVVSAQQDTARNLAARINTLSGELERLGVVKTDTEHMGGRTLGKWGEEFDTESDDGGYGSEPGIDEDEYERETHTPSVSGLSGSAVFGSTTPATGARLGLPRTTPKSSSAWRTPSAGGGRSSSLSAGGGVLNSVLKSPAAVNGSQAEGAVKLHWVTPGSSGRRTPGSNSSNQQREVRSSSKTATSSSAWQKFAVELSDSAKKSTGGSGSKSRVRTTVATPLPSSNSRSSAQKQQQRQQREDSAVSVVSPPRPPSPLQISAAAAVTPPPAFTMATPAAAFSFPGQPQTTEPSAQQQGFSTPAVRRLPGKLSFSPAAAATAPTAAPAAAAASPAASPDGMFNALSPLPGDTPVAAAIGSKASSTAFNFFSANPLFDRSPGGVPASPLAAVPPPALQLGAGARMSGSGNAAAAAARPPAAAKAKASQPPEPSMAALAPAAALEKKVLERESSTGSSPQPPPPAAAAAPAAVKPKPVAKPASKTTAQSPEPPAALLAAAAQAAKQLPEQANPAPAAASEPVGPSEAAMSAAVAAASRVLSSMQQIKQQPQGEAAAAAAKPQSSSQPSEPPMAMTQQGHAAMQRMAASQAASAAAAGSSASAPAKPKSSSQPPEPPAGLLKAAARTKVPQVPVPATTSVDKDSAERGASAPAPPGSSSQPFGVISAFSSFNGGAAFGFGSSSAASAAAASSDEPAAAGTTSAPSSSTNAADALSAMLGASGGDVAFGGFGALGLGGGESGSPPSSAAAPAPTSPFSGLSFGTTAGSGGSAFGASVSSAPAATTPAFGAFGSTASSSSAAVSSSSPFGSFGTFGAASSAAASSGGGGMFGSSSSVFGASSTSGAFGTSSSSAQSSSSPFGALFQAGGSSTATGGSGSVFGSITTSSAAVSSPFGAAAAPAASAAFGTPASATGAVSGAFGSSTSAPAFGQSTPFGAAASGGVSSPVVSSAFGVSSAPFGTPATPGTTSVFGTPAAGSAAGGGASSVFGSFGQSTAFGAQQTGSNPPSNPFGAAFGQSSPSPASPFGQVAAMGQTAVGGFGQATGFGQAAAPSSPFGGTPSAFNQPSTPAASFGQADSGGTPGSGSGSFGSGFGQAAASGSGGGFGVFGGVAPGGGFGAFQAGGGAGGFAAPNPFGGAGAQQQQQSSLWAARR